MSFKSLLKYGASALGSAASGASPFQIVSKAIADITGVNVKKEADFAKLNGEQVAQIEMKRMEIEAAIDSDANDVLKSKLADIQDARAANMALNNDSTLKYFLPALTVLSLLIISGFIFAVVFYPIPEKNIRIADIITGVVVGTILTSIFAYWFGSSLGSKLKAK